jgi:hypothetical protein
VALTNELTTLRRCLACGDLVDIEANFCPTCGTRQVDGIPRPNEPAADPEPPTVVTTPADPAVAAAATGWLLVGVVVALVLVVMTGLLAARLFTAADRGDGGGTGAAGQSGAPGSGGPAARAMDGYAPIAEDWRDKHEHVADQGSGDDSAGLATAAHDARAWIGVNSDQLTAVAANVVGASAPLYRQLVDIYSRRFTVLADLEDTATAGGIGPGAAAGELAELDALDREAATAVCAIADVMRTEGDDPADHLTPGMAVGC